MSLLLHAALSPKLASLSEMASKELHMSSFDTEIGEDVGKMVPDGEGCVAARVREGMGEVGECEVGEGEVGEGEVGEGGTAVSPVR